MADEKNLNEGPTCLGSLCGAPTLDNIEDDDEYEIVADAFDELLDSQEYDELVGEDELEEED